LLYKDSFINSQYQQSISMQLFLRSLSAETTCKLDILGLDSDTLGMDSCQVGVLKESNEVGFTCFLESSNGGRLETQVCLEILGNLTNESLERELSDQELSRLLVTTNLTDSNGSRSNVNLSYKIPVSVRLFDSTSCWCRLAGSLGCQLLSWGLSSSRLSCGLLGSCHFDNILSSDAG
jgi:hypothetical protein